jgi:hypothetical protein
MVVDTLYIREFDFEPEFSPKWGRLSNGWERS